MLRGNHLEVSYITAKLFKKLGEIPCYQLVLMKLNLVNQHSITANIQGNPPKKLAQISMTVVIQFSLETSKYFQNNILIDHPWKNGYET